MMLRLTDDGARPELDLHGCTVNEALRLTRRLLSEAARYGRNSVRLIHGQSTTASGKRTIKSALTELIESEQLSQNVSSTLKSEGYMIVALRRKAGPAPSGRLTLRSIS